MECLIIPPPAYWFAISRQLFKENLEWNLELEAPTASLNHQWTTLDLFSRITTPHHVARIPRPLCTTGDYTSWWNTQKALLIVLPRAHVGFMRLHKRKDQKTAEEDANTTTLLESPLGATRLETSGWSLLISPLLWTLWGNWSINPFRLIHLEIRQKKQCLSMSETTEIKPMLRAPFKIYRSVTAAWQLQLPLSTFRLWKIQIIHTYVSASVGWFIYKRAAADVSWNPSPPACLTLPRKVIKTRASAC